MSKNSELENYMTQLASNLRAKYGTSQLLSLSDMVQMTRPGQHNKSSMKYTRRQYRKMQSMNFKERALYELQLEQAKKAKNKSRNSEEKTYWVKVLFSNGQTRFYQLSKDLQKVCKQATPNDKKQSYLNGYLINVPITNYHKGKAIIDTALVVGTWLKPDHTYNCNKITRSQILAPELHKTFFGLLNDREEMYNFMKHDYTQRSQQRIRQSIYQFIPLHGYIKPEYRKVLDKC